jgi:glucokinase
MNTTKNMDFPVLGIDIGGTKIAVCLADSKGRILSSRRLPGGARQSYTQFLPQLEKTVNVLCRESGLSLDQVRACGISAPGPLDIPGGVLKKSPNMNWENAPVRRDLERMLGIPAALQNDAAAGALASWFFGEARGCRDFIYLTMSTGIGGGIVASGQLVEGCDGNAGELGHIILDLEGPVCGCGMRGCFEAFCGGRSIQKRLQAMVADSPDHPFLTQPEVDGDPEKLGFATLLGAVKRQVPQACELWDEICVRMAQGIGIVMMSFNPRLIVLGTMFYYSGHILMDPVRANLHRFAWPRMIDSCRLAASALGKEMGELAGAAVALYDMQKRGEWSPD